MARPVAAPPVSPLVYVHPVLAGVTLLCAFLAFRQGMAQRAQRLKKRPAPPGTLKQHVRLGPVAAVLMALSTLGGVGSMVALRSQPALATWHGRLAVVATLLFGALWWLGRRLLGQEKRLAQAHGLVGVAGLFLCGIAALLGIELLP